MQRAHFAAVDSRAAKPWQSLPMENLEVHHLRSEATQVLMSTRTSSQFAALAASIHLQR